MNEVDYQPGDRIRLKPSEVNRLILNGMILLDDPRFNDCFIVEGIIEKRHPSPAACTFYSIRWIKPEHRSMMYDHVGASYWWDSDKFVNVFHGMLFLRLV